MVKHIKKPARDKLQRMMSDLTSSNVKVGFFADQGTHPTAKMSYPSLMYLQEVKGVKSRNGKVRRRAFEITMRMQKNQLLSSVQLTLKRQLVGSGNMNTVKESFGNQTKKAITSTFGNSSLLQPNAPSTVKRKGFNAPLIETSDLKNKLVYRIVKKGS